jgi:hypothetical protein
LDDTIRSGSEMTARRRADTGPAIRPPFFISSMLTVALVLADTPGISPTNAPANIDSLMAHIGSLTCPQLDVIAGVIERSSQPAVKRPVERQAGPIRLRSLRQDSAGLQPACRKPARTPNSFPVSVRPTSTRIAVLPNCGEHIDIRAQAELRCALRSDVPT